MNRFSAVVKTGVMVSILGCGGAGESSGSSTSDYSGRHPVSWTSEGDPSVADIAGGPWTLQQTGTSKSAPSAGYCVGGVQQDNPGVEPMRPYYFPFVVGSGTELQGYFDYRPKDDDEAIVAAWSDDAGQTWNFQQKVLELTTQCPQTDADTNGGDDGQGHPYVANIGGQTLLYTLDRSAGNVDSAGLVVHVLSPTFDAPLDPSPAMADVPVRTTGLLAPDAIAAVVPGAWPTTVMYVQKQLDADHALPAEQQCGGAKANHDVTTMRLATTDDGVNFTDLGPVQGLNDSTDTSDTGSRWIGPRVTLLDLGGRWGLFFTAGGCVDNDSDAFHYIGYAESSDLVSWNVVDGWANPIASVTDAANAPIVGASQDWFAGRVYGPSATLLDDRTVLLTFAGYHTIKPKDAYDDYRTVGSVVLHSSRRIHATSGDGN